jgi:hypothetical protein
MNNNLNEDISYENIRLKEIENIKNLNKLDKEIKINNRKLYYKNENDLLYNGKIYFLSNTLFYSLITILIYLIYNPI